MEGPAGESADTVAEDEDAAESREPSAMADALASSVHRSVAGAGVEAGAMEVEPMEVEAMEEVATEGCDPSETTLAVAAPTDTCSSATVPTGCAEPIVTGGDSSSDAGGDLTLEARMLAALGSFGDLVQLGWTLGMTYDALDSALEIDVRRDDTTRAQVKRALISYVSALPSFARYRQASEEDPAGLQEEAMEEAGACAWR